MTTSRKNLLLEKARVVMQADIKDHSKAERLILIRNAGNLFVQTGTLKPAENLVVRDETFKLTESLKMNP